MPQATDINTPIPAAVAVAFSTATWPVRDRSKAPLTYQDAILHETCVSAMVTHKAMTALSLSIAEVPPDDPRHETVHAAVSRLLPDWHDQVEQAWSIPATGQSGLRDKAELLRLLIDRNEDGSVPGSPALSLAASLAADLLQLHGPAAP